MKKTSKRLLALVLSVLMLLATAPLSFAETGHVHTYGAGVSNDNGTHTKVCSECFKPGATFEFGSYPQSKMTDEALITALGTSTPAANGDIVYNGEKYRKGTDAGGVGTAYYKYEPIVWRILTQENGEVFALSDKNLAGGVPFNEDDEDNSWANSDLRAWLNEDFAAAAFSAEELAAVAISDVTTYKYDSTNVLCETQDKVFLLSSEEVTNSAYGFTDDASRVAVNTAYTGSFSGMNYAGDADWWFLRTPGYYSHYACNVYNSGSVDDTHCAVGYTLVGVRPALKLNLTSDIFSSSSPFISGSVVTEACTPVSDNNAVAATCSATGLTAGSHCSVCAGVITEQTETEKLPHTYGAGVSNDNGGHTKVCSECFKPGATFEFGSYPQSKVTDEALIAALDTSTPGANGDIAYNGEKYRKGKDAGGVGMAYYKYEPIVWRILAQENSEVFVVADKILASGMPFDADDSNWANSYLRAWLNEDFAAAAFSAEELAAVTTSDVTTYKYDSTDVLCETQDKVFALSAQEVNNPAYGFTDDASRIAFNTAYTGSFRDMSPAGSVDYWWLRSPGDDYDNACRVDYDGNVNYNFYIALARVGVRPALKLNLTSDIFSSSSPFVSGSVVTEACTPVSDNNAVAATCSATGLTAGSHCSVCAGIITAQTVTEKLPHTYGAWVSNDNGTHTRTCTVCDETAAGHAITEDCTIVPDAAVAATCSATGLTAGSHCSVCAGIITAQTETQKLPHTYGAWEYEGNGKHTRACTVCDETAAGHAITKDCTIVPDAAVAATCSATGLTAGSHCSVCAGIITAQTVTEKLPHTYGEWEYEGNGKHTRACTVCDETAAGHAITKDCTIVPDAAVAATCSATGLTAGSHCSVCAGVITAQTVTEKLPHTYGEWVSNDNGTHTRACTVCDETAAGHAITEDCTIVPDAAVAATCSATGLTAGSHCSVCAGIITAQTVTEKLPHTYGEWVSNDNGTHTRTCKNDASHTETAAHTFGEGVPNDDATFFKNGTKTRICPDCGATEAVENEDSAGYNKILNGEYNTIIAILIAIIIKIVLKYTLWFIPFV